MCNASSRARARRDYSASCRARTVMCNAPSRARAVMYNDLVFSTPTLPPVRRKALLPLSPLIFVRLLLSSLIFVCLLLIFSPLSLLTCASTSAAHSRCASAAAATSAAARARASSVARRAASTSSASRCSNSACSRASREDDEISRHFCFFSRHHERNTVIWHSNSARERASVDDGCSVILPHDESVTAISARLGEVTQRGDAGR